MTNILDGSPALTARRRWIGTFTKNFKPFHVSDVPEMDATAPEFKQDAPLAGIDDAAFYTPSFSLPPAPDKTGECADCKGRGHVHDCPTCDCTCESCDGTGNADPEQRISTTINGVHFGLNFVRMMASLPGLKISNSAVASKNSKRQKPLLFTFDGGCGALMPRLSGFDQHVEIEGSPT